MTRNRKTARPPRNVYERLSQRLDERAEREGCYDNTEKIRLMRQAYFRDVFELQKSGELKIPR